MATINVRSSNLQNLKIGSLRASTNVSNTRILRYYVDITHTILNLHKELSAPDIEILQSKVDVLISSWDKKYEAFLASQNRSQGKLIADEATIAAEVSRARLRGLLSETLSVNDEIDWEVLKPNERFRETPFAKQYPIRPKPPLPPEPPIIGIVDKLFGRAKKKRAQHEAQLDLLAKNQAEIEARYDELYREWLKEKSDWDAGQGKLRLAHEQKIARIGEEVDRLKERWKEGSPEAIVEHATIVLDHSDYPDMVPKDFSIAFDAETGILLVDYQLPSPESMPTAKTVRFNSTTGELSETQISKTEARDLYDTTCYQICLRTIHELFEADTPGHLKAVAFNGIVLSIDRATGAQTEPILLSVLAERADFERINLAKVDPKVCFKNLKGVSAANLSGLAPVPPVIRMDKDDKRFIEGKRVDLGSEGSVNLAAMDWEDFEHLIRELFEREFRSRGGEVRVTQASSDGGVDAVAFDPDPISGGKIVIQAKRYTKTVGVSAVRDLYGTSQAEGATKGILVTTADYGPDAYRFAQGKPITLLSGANLLHLLEKHGMRARIDLVEARDALGLARRD